MGTVETFVRLFRGRGNAYGKWGRPNPETGRSTGGAVRAPLTAEHFRRHLFSHRAEDWIGVYNVIDTRCSWGVVDMDVDDLVTMNKVRHALTDAHVPSWIEQTTRGYHLWVFPADQLVEAATMRRALTAACLAVGYSPKEVFPKQDRATGSALGNYVRLPLNSSQAVPSSAACRRFIHPNVTLLDMDMCRAPTAALVALAEMAPDDPQPVDIPVDIEAGLEVQWEVERIGGRVRTLWRDGPRFNHDRSSTLSYLAHCLREADVPAPMALAIVRSADQRWGKFTQRGDAGLAHLRKIVEQAYATRASA